MVHRKTLIALCAFGLGTLVGVPAAESAGRVLFAQNAANAKNAAKVGGVGVSATPKPHTLLPLNKLGKFPASVMPTQTQLAQGQTVTGVFGGQFTATAAEEINSTAVSFPLPSHEVVAVEQMGVLGGAVENPYCDGSLADPSAPQGILCLYPDYGSVANVSQDCVGVFPACTKGEGTFKVEVNPVYDGRYGFTIKWTAATVGPSYFRGTWAYTAAVKGKEPGEPVDVPKVSS